jgi:hypothetical protein
MTDVRDEVDRLLMAAQYVEQLLNSELQWLSNRISWLFVSQAFCLAAHAVVVTAQSIPLPLDYKVMVWAMPLFGILSCIFVYGSVLAARAVAYRLADERATLTMRINRLMGTSIPRIGARREAREEALRWTRLAGAAPHHILPLALLLIWLALFVARFLPAASAAQSFA